LEPVASHAQAGASLYGKIGILILVAGAQPETGWLPAAGSDAITAARPVGTDTAARPTGTTDEADAGAASSTVAEAGAASGGLSAAADEAITGVAAGTAAEAGADAVAKDTVTEAASGGLPTAADEADAGTRSPGVYSW